MREADKILWALDNSISPSDFERLCIDLLDREGYHHIVPIGGVKDHGRDAELRAWAGGSNGCVSIAFQFSLNQRWESKLRKDAVQIVKHRPHISQLVYVTSRRVTGAKQDSLGVEFQSTHGCKLTIYEREWLRHRLGEVHHDLVTKYLGITLEPTPSSIALEFHLRELDDYATKEILDKTGLELLRATLAGRTKKEPRIAEHWYELARVEFLARNYDTALDAVVRAFQLPADELLILNMTLFKAALLAEKGIDQNSRPLLIEAKNILKQVMPRLQRAVDHYNFANILTALGDTEEARLHYIRALDLQPGHAQTWKNLGSLLMKEGKHQAGLECIEEALKRKPELVEGHLCKATALLIFFENPQAAITSFQNAFRLSPDVERKWKYARYWFSRALHTVGRSEEALAETEKELSLRGDDLYLLNQKAVVLSELRRSNRAYEEPTLDFLKFRAHAIPDDFSGLAEIIEILDGRGQADDAWASIEANLDCKPFSVYQVAKKANIQITDLQAGFRYARLYGTFRERWSLDDHCVTLHREGLSPATTLLPALNYALIAPFGVAARDLRATVETDKSQIAEVSKAALNAMCRIFPVFGSAWLHHSEPGDDKEKRKLLSVGAMFLPDVVVAELAREIGFLRGLFGLQGDDIFDGITPNWSNVRADIAVRLLEQVVIDWRLKPDTAVP